MANTDFKKSVNTAVFFLSPNIRLKTTSDMGKRMPCSFIAASHSAANAGGTNSDGNGRIQVVFTRTSRPYSLSHVHYTTPAGENKPVQRDFSGSRNKAGFSGGKDKWDFLSAVIDPAASELNQKLLFTFKDVATRTVREETDGEDSVQICFVRRKRKNWQGGDYARKPFSHPERSTRFTEELQGLKKLQFFVLFYEHESN